MILDPECGGCQGIGAHKDLCSQVIGRWARLYGRYANQAEHLGDRVGSNNIEATNHLYRVSTLLRQQATEHEADYREQNPDAPTRTTPKSGNR